MIAVGGTDVHIGLIVNLRKFIEGQCIVGLCSVERESALMHKHFQMVIKGNFTSPLVLNKIRWYGCEESGANMENRDESERYCQGGHLLCFFILSQGCPT